MHDTLHRDRGGFTAADAEGGDALLAAAGFERALRRGDNRRFAGEDLMQGRPALLQGQIVSPAALGMVAAFAVTVIS